MLESPTRNELKPPTTIAAPRPGVVKLAMIARRRRAFFIEGTGGRFMTARTPLGIRCHGVFSVFG
jgi:hypothetical protein